MRNKIIALAISIIVIPNFAFAQKNKAYVGAEYTKNSINTGITNISSNLDEKDNGYSIFVGSEVKLNVQPCFSPTLLFGALKYPVKPLLMTVKNISDKGLF